MSSGEGAEEAAVERPTPMKLACASSSLHRDFESGDLTQLEFLDLCARELACDGVVLDVRHFPRTDDDYLAQVKKMAADRGLTIAALADAAFFTSGRDGVGDVLRQAVALGAPLVAAPLAREVDSSWTDQLARLNVATSIAKAANVTLAVRNAPETFAAAAHDFKRVAKEADSAWLRFGPEPLRLEANVDRVALEPNTVLLWSAIDAHDDRSIEETIAAFSGFRGHLALDRHDGAASAGELKEALHRWRRALAQREEMLDRR
ncbi:MAG: hypothetical protein WA814_06815 [Candidatus Baltobacteraceae bacterium]